MKKRIWKRICVSLLTSVLILTNVLPAWGNVYPTETIENEEIEQEVSEEIYVESEELFAELDLATPSESYLITFAPDTTSKQKEVEQAILELDMVAQPEAFDSLEELTTHISSGDEFDIRLRRVAALQASAILAQKQARSILEKLVQQYPQADITYNSYWISNTLSLEAPVAVVEYISGLSNVLESKKNEEVETVPYTEAKNVMRSIAPVLDEREVEENLRVLRADKVWNELNITGEGVVVGIIDQAVDYEHPALLEHFRGFDEETGSVSLEGNYIDFVDGGAEVGDDYHGTHVTGIVVGGESGEGTSGRFSYNRIGMAPGAEFIVARAFKDGAGGSNENIIKACEWMMAPGGDPLKAPKIVNHSWSDGKNDMDLWFENTARTMRAAGILNIMSSGNNGSVKALPGSVDNPGSSPQVFTVGASDNRKILADFSRRGPSPYADATFKPDVVAPGVQVRSAVPGGEYTAYNGTSMAAPHVAGVAALVLQANPNLSVVELENLLKGSAIPRTDADYPSSPNQGYGYGFVDAYAAVKAAMNGIGDGAVAADYRMLSGKVQIVAGSEATSDAIEGMDIRLSQVGYTNRPLRASIDFYQSDFPLDNIEKIEYILEAEDGTTKTSEFIRSSASSQKFYAEFTKDNFENVTTYVQKIKLTGKTGDIYESEARPVSILDAVYPGQYKVDFETGAPGFAYKGNFSHGIANLNIDPKPTSGSNFAGLNIGSPYLGTLPQSILELPKVDLRNLGEDDLPELVYKEYASWDSAVLGIQAELEGETTASLHNYGTRENGTWRERRFDLSRFKGKQPSIFFFHLVRNVSDGYGLFIDDVAFTLNGQVQEMPQLQDVVVHTLQKIQVGNQDFVGAKDALVVWEEEGVQIRVNAHDGTFVLDRISTEAGNILIGAKGYKTKRIAFAGGSENVDLGAVILEKETDAVQVQPQEPDEVPEVVPGAGIKMLGYDNNNPLSGGAVFARMNTGVAVEMEAPEDGVLSHVMVYFAGHNPYFRNGKVSLEIKQVNEAGRLIDIIAPQEVEGVGGTWNRYDLSEYQEKLSGKFYVVVRQILPKGEGPAVAIDTSIRPGTLEYKKGYYYNGAFESLFGQGVFGMPMIRTYVRTGEDVQDEDAQDPVFDASISKEPKAEMLMEEGQAPKDLVIIGDYEISPSRGMITRYLRKDEFVERPFEERILEIPAEIGGVKIVSIGESAFGYSWGSYEVKKIILPEGIKEVNESAFSMLGSHEIILPSTLEKIYPRAFKKQNIRTLQLPEGLRHIGASAFENCYNLESLYIPDSVEEVEMYAFQVSAWGGTSQLRSIRLPENEHFTTVHANAFANHNQVSELHIPEQITAISSGAFEGLGIQTVKLPEKLKTLGDSAFANCRSLSQVYFPSGLKEIGSSAFASCNLQDITLPIDLEVIDRGAFKGNQLTKVVIPEKVRFINYMAFNDNPNLTTIRLNESILPRAQGYAKVGYPTNPHPFGNAITRLEIYRAEQVNEEARNMLETKNPPAQIHILGEEETRVKTFVSADGKVTLKVESSDIPADARLMVEAVDLQESDKKELAKLGKDRALEPHRAYRFYLVNHAGEEIALHTEYSISFHKTAFVDEGRVLTGGLRESVLLGVPEVVLQETGGRWMRTGATFEENMASVRASRNGKVTLLELKYVPKNLPENIYYGIENNETLSPVRFTLRTGVEGGNGSIQSFVNAIEEGTQVNVSYRPDTGYEVASVLINGEAVPVQGLSVDVVMNEDKEVVVSFKKISTSGGSISGGSSGGGSGVRGSSVRRNSQGQKSAWVYEENGWRYKDSNGFYPRNQWLQINRFWYFFNEQGYIATGWLLNGGKWYYLQSKKDATEGRMATGWMKDEKDNHWYYLNPVTGEMQVGWQKIGDVWYYLNPVSQASTWFWNGNTNRWEYQKGTGRPLGAMYANEKTPDGYFVNASGAWVE